MVGCGMSRFGVIAVAVLVMAAGCAGPVEEPARPPGKATTEQPWVSCAAAAPPPLSPEWAAPDDNETLPRLADGFQPVAVVVCSSSPTGRTVGSEEVISTESRADNVTALVAELRLPDKPRTHLACTREMHGLPWFALLDEQGRWTRARAPLDDCGKARVEVLVALDELRLVQTSSRLIPASTRPVPRIESSEAAAAACTPQWADLVGATAGRVATGGPAVVPPGFDGPVRVRLCVYRVPAERQRTGRPAGDLDSGRYLDDKQWAEARREIESGGPAVACTTPASRFAVLHFGAGQISVELDGCRRLLATAADGGETVRQAAPALVKQLTAG